MELVYLWVEGYKNIRRQGFNFSPQFECEFKDEYEKDEHGKEKLKDNCELVIKSKEHLENFFGDNINVTSIVGENGSGKSSIMELLSSILTSRTSINFFYIVNNGNENLYYEDNIHMNFPIKKLPTILSQYIDMFYLNISHLERDGIIKNDAVSIEDPINYIGVYAKNDFERDTVTEKTIYPTFSEFKLSQFNFLQTFAISNLLKDKKYEKLLFETFKIKKPYSIQIEYDKKSLETIKILNTPIDSSIPKKIDDLLELLKGIDNNLIIESGKISEFFKLSRSIYNLEKEFKLKFLAQNGEVVKLSAGEKTILFYLERIDYMLDRIKKEKKPAVLLFDEIELYLHPMWQKRILNIILEFLKAEKLEHLLHIIIASHSPFILSDLPKENVIFLKDGKQVDVDINPFGANIHTLLSHGFFMQDGLMGEFAKTKIQSIIKYHEKILEKDLMKDENRELRGKEKEKYNTHNKKNFWNIQSIIGDDYLKQVIKNHLIEIEKILLGQDEAKNEEIKRLQAQIDFLGKS